MVWAADVESFWRRYLATVPADDRTDEPVVTAGRAGSPELADELAGLYLAGTKTAGSSLLEDFLAAGDTVPRAGDLWVLLGRDGEPRCILRTVSVERSRFGDIPERIAIAEGEGDLSVAAWTLAHREAYGPHLVEWGIGDLDDATVLTQHFEVVFR